MLRRPYTHSFSTSIEILCLYIIFGRHRHRRAENIESLHWKCHLGVLDLGLSDFRRLTGGVFLNAVMYIKVDVLQLLASEKGLYWIELFGWLVNQWPTTAPSYSHVYLTRLSSASVVIKPGFRRHSKTKLRHNTDNLVTMETTCISRSDVTYLDEPTRQPWQTGCESVAAHKPEVFL